MNINARQLKKREGVYVFGCLLLRPMDFSAIYVFVFFLLFLYVSENVFMELYYMLIE